MRVELPVPLFRSDYYGEHDDIGQGAGTDDRTILLNWVMISGAGEMGIMIPPLGVKMIQSMLTESVGNVSTCRGMPAGRGDSASITTLR